MNWEIITISKDEIEKSLNPYQLFQEKGLHLNDERYMRIMCYDNESRVFTCKVARVE